MNFFSLTTLLLSFCFLSSLSAEGAAKINLIYKHTGFGLGRDAVILTEELEKLGYEIHPYKVNAKRAPKEADINIFLEEVNENHFGSAKKNYLIPNAEWYLASLETLAHFDMILCKTRECERIFEQHHPNTVYMGFTSVDRYDPMVKKNYRQALHVAGKSQQKGTDAVVEAWSLNPQLPGILIYRHTGRCDYTPIWNMLLFCQFVPDKNLIQIQNTYAIHLCPSETEGYGQYMMEALSCGAIPVTTNAPPMNEFVQDPRCLVNYTHTAPQHFAINYYVDPVHLGEVVDQLMQLPEEELAEMGKKNRQFYLENKRAFQQKIREIFARTPQ